MTHKKDLQLARAVVSDPVHFLAFGFGVGLLPAGGTWGSLLGLAIYWLLPEMNWPWMLALIIGVFAVGIPLCDISARRIGVHDHNGIVWDEIAGMLIVAASVPRSLVWLTAAFLAFRLFDIWKPWPIRDLDHSVSGGLGIMLDDVVAAVYAVLFLLLLQRIVTVF